jgi:hypothetical protein
MKTYVVKTIARRINIRFVFWGLAIVTDWERDEWAEAIMIAMFPFAEIHNGVCTTSEYPFLTRHLWRNWWWIGKSAKRWLKSGYPFVRAREYGFRMVSIPRADYLSLKNSSQSTSMEIEAYVGGAYQDIIDGLSGVTGKTMDREAIIQFLKTHKAIYTAETLRDWSKMHPDWK